MNKSEMLTQLEGRLGSRGAATAALDAVLDEIVRAVAASERVTLTGFGTFERVERPARTGRNPSTGATIQLPASATPRFHAGTALRAAVAGSAQPRAEATESPSGTPAHRRTRAPGPVAPAPTVEVPTAAKAPKAAKSPKAAKPPKKSAAGKAAKAVGGKKKKK